MYIEQTHEDLWCMRQPVRICVDSGAMENGREDGLDGTCGETQNKEFGERLGQWLAGECAGEVPSVEVFVPHVTIWKKERKGEQREICQ